MYIQDPPSVTFKVHGKLITDHSQKIAINALEDAEEAEKITGPTQGEETREDQPFSTAPRPSRYARPFPGEAGGLGWCARRTRGAID